MLVAALNNSKPRFPPFFIPQPCLPPPQMPGIENYPILDGPLYGTEPLEQVLRGSPFGEQGMQILQRMRDMTDATLSYAGLPIYGAAATSTPHHDIIGPGPTSVPLSSSMNTSDNPTSGGENEDSLLPQSLLTPLIHASNIYTTLLTPFLAPSYLSSPIKSFSAPCNHKALEALVQALHFPENDATFAQYPGVMIWILLVAAVAAEERDERGFLFMFLIRVGSGSVHGWWEGMRESIEKFRRVREIVG